MGKQPNLQTERLLLRPFVEKDATRVHELAGDKQIAATTLNVPHPYKDGDAEKWISTLSEAFDSGTGVTFAIDLQAESLLIGAIGLVLNRRHERGEMGYWIGTAYWGNGYCTEAAKSVLTYGFDVLGLHKIHAKYMDTNPASGRVLAKIGMSHEGLRREHYKKWDTFTDHHEYGILATEYRNQQTDSQNQANAV